MSWVNNVGERGYLDLLQYIMVKGADKTDRTGVGTRSIFGAQLRFDLEAGFPLLTTKKIFTKGVFGELIWLISGNTNIRWLQENGIHIWDDWADDNGDLGPVYGAQWRHWGDTHHMFSMPFKIDQLADAIHTINTNPDSRRIIVTAWNPSDVPNMALPSCHMMYQFEVHGDRLSCHMYMRSADVFLGVPFNIASYAALTHMVAQVTGTKPGHLIVSFGDVHIYNNHFEQVKLQLTRTPLPPPRLILNPDVTDIDSFTLDDLKVIDYNCHPAIKAEVAV